MIKCIFTVMIRSLDVLSVYQGSEFILNDPDRYIRDLSASDLIARNVSSADAYLDLSAKTVTYLSPAAIQYVQHCYKNAVKYLFKIGVYLDVRPKIIFIDGDAYEGGYPHTRLDVIFMNSKITNMTERKLSALFVHELIHIYQRRHPMIVARSLHAYGYMPLRKIVPEDNIRSNPDTNKLLYADAKGKLAAETYRSRQPWSITDILGEHPYETMAYDIQNKADAYFKTKNIL